MEPGILAIDKEYIPQTLAIFQYLLLITMDIQTQNPSISASLPILTLPSKPILSQASLNPHHLYYATSQHTVCQLDITKQIKVYESKPVHQGRIGSMRVKDGLVFTGGYDATVQVFEAGSWQHVHTFQKIPSKFNSLDKSEHILCGASSSSIHFWDLRKMKHRSEFRQSFNGQICHLRFQDNNPTNLLGCSVDGMINMFDLTEPNQEEAFSWGYKVLESPVFFSAGDGGRMLVRSMDHNLFKIQGGDLLGKISPNNPQNPKHIIYSQFKPHSKYQIYQYFTWSPQQKLVQHWQGNFLDKTNTEKCQGYIEDVDDVEIFDVISREDGKYVGVYCDEKGGVHVRGFAGERKKGNWRRQGGVQHKSGEKGKSKSLGKKDGQMQPKITNKNGYVLEKPSSSFANHKKFRPY